MPIDTVCIAFHFVDLAICIGYVYVKRTGSSNHIGNLAWNGICEICIVCWELYTARLFGEGQTYSVVRARRNYILPVFSWGQNLSIAEIGLQVHIACLLTRLRLVTLTRRRLPSGRLVAILLVIRYLNNIFTTREHAHCEGFRRGERLKARQRPVVVYLIRRY